MTAELQVQDREVVIPGQVLAQGMGYLPGQGTYREDETIKANKVGLVQFEGKVIKLIPLSGVYAPKIGDKVIGQVIDVLLSGWRLDISCPYSAVLSTKDGGSGFIGRGKDLTEIYALGDYVVGKIVNVTSQKLIDVTMRAPGARKLPTGRIMKVNPYKIPRIIGKEGTMIALLRQATGCDIVAGQNGMVWMSGSPKDEVLVSQIIRKIENEAHMSGLTDRVKATLQENGKTVPDHIEPVREQEEQQFERRERFDGGERSFDRPRFDGPRNFDGPRHGGNGGGDRPRFQRPFFKKPDGEQQ